MEGFSKLLEKNNYEAVSRWQTSQNISWYYNEYKWDHSFKVL